MGQNRKLCLSTHGHLPGTLWYALSTGARSCLQDSHTQSNIILILHLQIAVGKVSLLHEAI